MKEAPTIITQRNLRSQDIEERPEGSFPHSCDTSTGGTHLSSIWQS